MGLAAWLHKYNYETPRYANQLRQALDEVLRLYREERTASEERNRNDRETIRILGDHSATHERERDEATEKIDVLSGKLERASGHINRIGRERDEARNRIEKAKSILHATRISRTVHTDDCDCTTCRAWALLQGEPPR